MAKDDRKKPDNDAARRSSAPYIPRHAVDPASVLAYGRAGESESFRAPLLFQKCSDVNTPFNYLEVSKGENKPAFMWIGVTLDYKLCFQLFPTHDKIELRLDDLMEIYAVASAFLPEAILLGDPVLDAENELRASGREPRTD